MSTIAQLVGTYTVTQAELISAFQRSGVRADDGLRALAPYESSANDTPTPLSQYAGTYTLDTAAKVIDVIGNMGPRGHDFMEQLAIEAAS